MRENTKNKLCIKQRDKLTSCTFQIEEDGVVCNLRRILRSSKYKVPFASIPDEPIIVSLGSRKWAVLAGVFTVFSLIRIYEHFVNGGWASSNALWLYLGATVVFYTLFWSSYHKYQVYNCGDRELAFFKKCAFRKGV